MLCVVCVLAQCPVCYNCAIQKPVNLNLDLQLCKRSDATKNDIETAQIRYHRTSDFWWSEENDQSSSLVLFFFFVLPLRLHWYNFVGCVEKLTSKNFLIIQTSWKQRIRNPLAKRTIFKNESIFSFRTASDKCAQRPATLQKMFKVLRAKSDSWMRWKPTVSLLVISFFPSKAILKI